MMYQPNPIVTGTIPHNTETSNSMLEMDLLGSNLWPGFSFPFDCAYLCMWVNDGQGGTKVIYVVCMARDVDEDKSMDRDFGTIRMCARLENNKAMHALESGHSHP